MADDNSKKMVSCPGCSGQGHVMKGGIGPHGPAGGSTMCNFCVGTGMVTLAKARQMRADAGGPSCLTKLLWTPVLIVFALLLRATLGSLFTHGGQEAGAYATSGGGSATTAGDGGGSTTGGDGGSATTSGGDAGATVGGDGGSATTSGGDGGVTTGGDGGSATTTNEGAGTQAVVCQFPGQELSFNVEQAGKSEKSVKDDQGHLVCTVIVEASRSVPILDSASYGFDDVRITVEPHVPPGTLWATDSIYLWAASVGEERPDVVSVGSTIEKEYWKDNNLSLSVTSVATATSGLTDGPSLCFTSLAVRVTLNPTTFTNHS